MALWGLPERDPLFELRLLAADRIPTSDRPPNAPPPGRAVTTVAGNLTSSLADELAEAGLVPTFSRAVDTVITSDVGRDLLRMEPASSRRLYLALARAFVAEATVAADMEAGELLPLDGAHRDRLIDAITGMLAGSLAGTSGRGAMAGLGRAGVAIALRMGMPAVERRRAAITQASAPAAGDVLHRRN